MTQRGRCHPTRLGRLGLAMLCFLCCLTIGGCWAGRPELNRPNLIAVSPDGKSLFISDSRNSRVLVVDREFRVRHEIPLRPEQAVWGLNTSAAGEIVIAGTRLAKATFDAEEKRANAVAEVQFMSFDGRPGDKLEWRSEHGTVVYPRQAFPLPDGGVAVTDLRKNKVFLLERNGTMRISVGEFGRGDGQLYCPSDVIVDAAGKLLVVDSYNHRLVEFAADGKYLRTIGRMGSGPGELLFPQNIARDETGRIYCTDMGNMRVSVFDANGAFVRHIQMPLASESRGLCELFGIAVATAPAELFVADSLNSCVYIFDPEGRPRATIDRVRF